MRNSEPAKNFKPGEEPSSGADKGLPDAAACTPPESSPARRLAHDLNNTFASILIAIEMLRAKSTTAELLDLANLLETSANQGLEISRQILTAARSGTLTLQAGRPDG
jgi:hypothetical protein